MGHDAPHGIRIYPMTAGSQIHLVTTSYLLCDHIIPHTYVIPMDLYIIPIHNVNHNPAPYSPFKVHGRYNPMNLRHAPLESRSEPLRGYSVLMYNPILAVKNTLSIN